MKKIYINSRKERQEKNFMKEQRQRDGLTAATVMHITAHSYKQTAISNIIRLQPTIISKYNNTVLKYTYSRQTTSQSASQQPHVNFIYKPIHT